MRRRVGSEQRLRGFSTEEVTRLGVLGGFFISFHLVVCVLLCSFDFCHFNDCYDETWDGKDERWFMVMISTIE